MDSLFHAALHHYHFRLLLPTQYGMITNYGAGILYMSTPTNIPGVIRLKPQQYIHVLDNNTGVTRLEVGPQTITLQDHERLVLDPQAMVVVPPRYYCTITNPVLRDEQGQPLSDAHGQIKLAYGETEIRFSQDPFPLYPGEELLAKIQRLQVVETNTALRLRAIRDFTETVDNAEFKRLAGDEWLFEGPGTYIPRVDVEVLETIKAIIIKPNEALRLRARQNCVDRLGNKRRAGEEWLVREEGAYLPGVDEEIIDIIEAYVLTDKTALHLRAIRTFVDVFGKKRKAGDEWLVIIDDAETHIPDVYEEVIGKVEITTLDDREWCIVQDPIDADGKPQLGKSEVRQGCLSFFLHPGESLDGGIQQVYVLGEQEALLLKAKEGFTDGSGEQAVTRQPGDLWMIEGPCDYIPLVQVEVLKRRKAIPLDKNEGIYVRDVKSGELKLVSGPQAYLLSPYEELWAKELSPLVEGLLEEQSDFMAEMRRQQAPKAAPEQKNKRDATRAVVFHVPQNSAVQLHNYKNRTARLVFGPDLVMLGPDEAFTVISLSGGKPKQAHAIKTLALFMGPDFMTDVFTVETSDHARLQLQLAYNWYFDVPDRNDSEVAARIFQVPDFVGDACKAIASRVRGRVAGVKFDDFHRNSAKIIRTAVFGTDEQGRIGKDFRFETNNLVITNIDIQAVEPVDEETLKNLQKSVQIAIKITSDAQEAAARHDAERVEQEAKARLERQGIVDTRDAEAERKKLLELRAENAAIESTGQATAEAKAAAEASRIKGETTVNLARQESEATRVRNQTELEQLKARQAAELEHQQALTQLEIEKAERMATIRTEEFKNRMAAIGPETLKAIATAGPTLQADLLKGLGLQSVLITDGHSPVNLFNTADGLLGGMTGQTTAQEEKAF
jgi:major vault protein